MGALRRGAALKGSVDVEAATRMHGRPTKVAETILFSVRDKCQHSLIAAWGASHGRPDGPDRCDHRLLTVDRGDTNLSAQKARIVEWRTGTGG